MLECRTLQQLQIYFEGRWYWTPGTSIVRPQNSRDISQNIFFLFQRRKSDRDILNHVSVKNSDFFSGELSL